MQRNNLLCHIYSKKKKKAAKKIPLIDLVEKDFKSGINISKELKKTTSKEFSKKYNTNVSPNTKYQ